jgi:hypothetical protein
VRRKAATDGNNKLPKKRKVLIRGKPRWQVDFGLEPVGKLGRQQRIYSNETTLNLMAAAMSTAKTRTVIAPLALGFFGCMRPEEITSEKPKEKGLPVEKWFGCKGIDLEHWMITPGRVKEYIKSRA